MPRAAGAQVQAELAVAPEFARRNLIGIIQGHRAGTVNLVVSNPFFGHYQTIDILSVIC